MGRLVLMLVLIVAVAGTTRAAPPPVRMPDLSIYPYTEEALWECEGIASGLKRINYDSEESRAWPVYAASAWFILDDGPRQEQPFLVGIFSLNDSENRYYFDLDRNRFADEVLDQGGVDARYSDACDVAHRLK